MKLRLAISPADSIQLLFWLRNVAIVGQLAAITVVRIWLGIMLPLTPMLIAVMVLAGFNIFTALRLRTNWHVTHPEVAGQLAADMLILTVLLHFSGGTVNPFASLYLIPISLAAIILPAVYAWGISIAAIAAYSLLMVWFVPLDHNMNGLFNLHLDGMWINFMLSVVLICAFLASMARIVKRRDHELARMREAVMRNEHINAIATLAAGTVHELSTPLATMTILVSEMKAEYAAVPGFAKDMDMLASSIGICRNHLDALRKLTTRTRPATGQTSGLREFLAHSLDQWRLVRPSIVLECEWKEPFQDVTIGTDDGLSQALMNYLNNAADAGLENGDNRVIIRLESDGATLRIRIDDRGRHPDQKLRSRVGEMFFTSKEHGLGLGLALSNANLERLGGRASMTAHTGSGTRVEISLPLETLRNLAGQHA